MRLQWIGGPTTRIDIGDFRILTDPMFGEGPESFVMRRHPSTGQSGVPIARLSPLPPVALDDLDLVMASHLHADHFDPTAVERLGKDLELVAPATNVPQLREWGFQRVVGMQWEQERTWHKNGQRLRVVALAAHHAHDSESNHELGTVNGYLIEHHSAGSTFRIYWTGDTVWFDALVHTAKNLPPIDLLLPHLGGVGKDGGPWGTISLDAAEGTRVTVLIDSGTTIPIHHSTFPFYVEPISEFVRELASSTYPGRLVLLREGESWTSR